MSNNRDLAISATSKIYEKVRRAMGERDSDKRWFWELLQNAKDTVVFKTGGYAPYNIPDKKVSARLVISSNESDGIYVRFEHDGNPFMFSNHPYKYDDPKCLLLADSGKIEEDESMREDITGQFGTGFLSTHILSLRILVEGIFLNRDNKTYSFLFELDRRKYNNKLQLAEKVEKSLDQYDTDFKEGIVSNNFDTKFTYYLNDNEKEFEEGINVVNKGIEGIEHYLPFVLTFSREIATIEIVDEFKTKTVTTFTRNEDLIRKSKSVCTVEISKNIYSLDKTLIEKKTIVIATCSDIENSIDLAIEIKPNNGTYEIIPLQISSPVLFCTFPLIGSDKWRFPLMVNCPKFYPRTERDGISLLTGKDNGNQKRIQDATDLYKIFVSSCIENKWTSILWLALTQYEVCPDWVSEEWYIEIYSEVRNFLLSQEIILNEAENQLPLRDALIPVSESQDNFEAFWSLCFDFIGAKMPNKKEAFVWSKIINVNYKEWQDLIFDIDRLLKEIQNYKSLSALATDKFNGDIAVATKWLNGVIGYIVKIVDRKTLLNKYEIIPNQIGGFKKLDDLRYDVNIPEELKDVLTLFHKDKRDKLIHCIVDES